MESDIRLDACLAEHLSLFNRLRGLQSEIIAAAKILTSALRQCGKILICGNGGSAADAQHFAAELIGRFQKERDSHLWRRVFKPLYREYNDIARARGKFVFMHSDGYITDIIGDLIEVGVDALNSWNRYALEGEWVPVPFAELRWTARLIDQVAERNGPIELKDEKQAYLQLPVSY